MRRIPLGLAFLILAAPLWAQTDLCFPHIAIGGNPAYETVLHIMNEVETSHSIVIEVFQGRLSGSANGSPLQVTFEDGTIASSRTVTLSPYQEYSTVISGTDSTLRDGWIRIRSTTTGGKISGSLLFRQRSGGALIDSVGNPGTQRFRHAVIQVDQREKGSDTGIAFANPDSTAITVILDLFQGSVRVASPLSVTLQPNQHFARLVSEMFPFFGGQQGTLVIASTAGRSVPTMALRLDGAQLTSIPVRPLGFSFQYAITNDSGAILESGYWLFDFVGFNLVGSGKTETPAITELTEVTGSWIGTNFQFRYRKTLTGGAEGMVVFIGTSAGQESTVGSDGKSKAVTGKAITIGADGKVVSTNNFTAYHKFGAAPQ